MPQRWLAAVGALMALAVLAVGCGGGVGPAGQAGTSAWEAQPPGRAGADRAAQALVDAVQPPSTSTALDRSPHALLDGPPSQPADDRLVDRHRWWRVAPGTGDPLAYLSSHLPPGLVVVGRGSSARGAPVTPATSFLIAAPIRADLPGHPQLLLTVVGDSPGRGPFLRVDGQVVWYAGRSPLTRAPAQGSVIVALIDFPGRSRQVVDPVAVSRLTAEFNALVPARSGVRNLPACVGSPRAVTVSFIPPGRQGPILVATFERCGGQWSVKDGNGATLPGLADSGPLLADVLQMLGLTMADL